MILIEWAEAYLRHRDLFEHRIKDLEIRKHKEFDEIRITERDGERRCLVSRTLGKLIEEEATTLIVDATEENFRALIDRWDSVKKKRVKIIFANTRNNEKWVVIPRNHAQIADPASLEQGLRTMYEAVL